MEEDHTTTVETVKAKPVKSKGWGGARPGSGRKPKEQSEKLLELIDPMEKDAIRVLHQNIKEGKDWAVRMWFNYKWGKPIERKDVKLDLPQLVVNNDWK